MAKQYEYTRLRWLGNKMAGTFIRLGILRGSNYLLTVRGRKTGQLHTTPVTLVEGDDGRWLVAPYGNVNWARNARAAGEVTLRQGRSSETLRAIELGPEEAGPILQRYVQQVSIVRPYFDAQPDSPVSDFIAEASRHPVFRLER